MAEILIVDDERTLREGMKANLRAEGYEVRTARDGEDALVKISEKRPDLVLLDVMMPKMNGFLCCEEIRKTDRLLPVIFLTAKDAEGDQLRGLGLGADDFVSKTASDTILFARIGRALSRMRDMNGREADATAVVRLGPVTVNLKTYAVLVGDKEVEQLTKTEADVFGLFVSHRGEYLGVDDIISGLRGIGFACEDAMVYSHIFNLRRKLGPAGDMIANRRGVGYALVP